jgi:polysaccharide pyruvyl transferase WcaK-like protein
MTEFGRSMYCQHIETFDVDHVMGQVRQVLADLEAARERIALRNVSIRTELARQQALLLSRVLVDRRAAALPLAQDALR